MRFINVPGMIPHKVALSIWFLFKPPSLIKLKLNKTGLLKINNRRSTWKLLFSRSGKELKLRSVEMSCTTGIGTISLYTICHVKILPYQSSTMNFLLMA